jgi:predicted GTPase
MVKDLLTRNDKAVKRALVVIWERQTEDEKAAHTTHENNGIGFNGVDAPILTSFVEQMKRKGETQGLNWKQGEAWLSPKQVQLARKKVMKYSGQLFRIMVEKPRNQARDLGLID